MQSSLHSHRLVQQAERDRNSQVAVENFIQVAVARVVVVALIATEAFVDKQHSADRLESLGNVRFGWQSLDGSTISTAGSVNFGEDAHGTRVTVHLQYNPPGGKLGAAIAKLFGEEPNQTIREDLRRFKQLMEAGEIPTTQGQPSGRKRRPSYTGTKA